VASMGVLYYKNWLEQVIRERKISIAKAQGRSEHELKICDPEGASLWEILAPPRWTTHIAAAALIPPAFYLSGRILNEGFRGGFWYIMSLTPLMLNWTEIGRIGGYKIGSILSSIGLCLTTASCLKVAGNDMGSFVLCGALSSITPAYCLYDNFSNSSARVQDLVSSYSWVNFQAQWDERDTDREGLSEEDIQDLVASFVTNILDKLVSGWKFTQGENIRNVYAAYMRPLIKDNVNKLVTTLLDEKRSRDEQRSRDESEGIMVKPKLKKEDFLDIFTQSIKDLPFLMSKTTSVKGGLEIAKIFDHIGH